MAEQTKSADRKDAHIGLALDPLAMAAIDAGFDRVRLDHCAIPECDLGQIDLSTEFLEYQISAPLFIGSMTGGTTRATSINHALAEVAETAGIGFAVGSQRATLEAGNSQSELRAIAPSIPLIGNLGGIQLAQSDGLDLARRAVDDLQADAIAIHLNPLQEAVQPEGERDWRHVLAAIEQAVSALPCKVIVKEVGAGIGAAVARRLFDVGVWAVDVAGLGGTNWTRIEAARREDPKLFAPFLDWGTPTVTCLRDISTAMPEKTLLASGGVRHGLDAAKAIWLGASAVSLAGPVLKALVGSHNGVPDPLAAGQVISDLKAQMALALFLTGAPDISQFRRVGGRIQEGA
jgi:isopentenyl-diphosphate delta-isomerase